MAKGQMRSNKEKKKPKADKNLKKGGSRPEEGLRTGRLSARQKFPFSGWYEPWALAGDLWTTWRVGFFSSEARARNAILWNHHDFRQTDLPRSTAAAGEFAAAWQ